MRLTEKLNLCDITHILYISEEYCGQNKQQFECFDMHWRKLQAAINCPPCCDFILLTTQKQGRSPGDSAPLLKLRKILGSTAPFQCQAI